MPLVEKVEHIYEPNPLACGQAVLAMLSGLDVNEIFDLEKPEHISLVENNIIYCVEISDFDIKNISEEYSIYNYQIDCRNKIEEIFSNQITEQDRRGVLF